jgi:hypothetical protein
MRVRPGWLTVLLAVVLVVSAWMPWLTTSAGGGAHANAIGGKRGGYDFGIPQHFGAGQLMVLLTATLIVAGAMSARGISARVSSLVALALSLVLMALQVWYYSTNVHPPVAAGYGMYLAAVLTIGAVLCSLWAFVVALSARQR